MQRPRTFALIAWLVVAANGCRPTPPPAAPATANTVADDDGLRLPIPQPQVGDKKATVDDVTMIFRLESQPGQMVEIVSVRHRQVRQEVLAVADGMITRLKVSYGVSTETQTMEGRRQDGASPLAGKTYVVWRDGGKLQATREDGSAPPAEELAEVRKSHRDVGQHDPMDRIVAAKTWKPGVRVVFTADELAQLNAIADPDTDDPVGNALALTLTRVDAELATFDMDTKLRATSPKGSIDIDTTGHMIVERATGRLREGFMRGPFAGNLGMVVTGTLENKRVYTY